MTESFMEHALVSVIIPVYNAEKTLARCMESIINQSLKNIEIILINDGSTDKSQAICRRHQEMDARILLIDKKNEGVSSARNVGIRAANAPYLMFVDSDDYLDKEMCQALYKKAVLEDADFIFCDYYEVDQENNLRRVSMPCQIDLDDVGTFSKLFQNYQINQVWNKLYKKELINDLFQEEINAGEDLLFNVEYMNQVKRTCVVSIPLYYYTLEDKNRIAKNSFLSLNKIYEGIYQYVENHFSQKEVLYELLEKRYFKEYSYLLKLLSLKDGVECNLDDGRKMAKEMGRRFSRRSVEGFLWNIIINLKLEWIIILIYKWKRRTDDYSCNRRRTRESNV